MLTWLFGHFLVELSPIFILLLVLGLRGPAGKGSTLELLLGDGILFFFSLVLSVGLFSDLLKKLLDIADMMPRYQVVQFLMLFLLFTVACWTGYFFTQIRRSESKRTSPWLSVGTTAVIVIFVGWIRFSFGIW
jgi:uncharacterized BrkB/YihY/UPF0761 family membrane protein